MSSQQITTQCECCGAENVEVEGIYRALFPPLTEAELAELRTERGDDHADFYEQGMNTAEQWIVCGQCAQLDTPEFHQVMQARMERLLGSDEHTVDAPA